MIYSLLGSFGLLIRHKSVITRRIAALATTRRPDDLRDSLLASRDLLLCASPNGRELRVCRFAAAVVEDDLFAVAHVCNLFYDIDEMILGEEEDG